MWFLLALFGTAETRLNALLVKLCGDNANAAVTKNIFRWPRGVTVSTLDSESSDRGSNPREVSYGAKHSSLGVRLPIQGGPREISANVTFTWIFEFQNIPDSKSVGHILR